MKVGRGPNEALSSSLHSMEGIPWKCEVDNYENSGGYDQSALYMCEIVKELISQ